MQGRLLVMEHLQLMGGTAAFYDMKRQYNLTAAMLEVADKELQVLSD